MKIGHPSKGRIWLAVNGKETQSGDLAQMIWNVPEIIAQLSKQVSLDAGDIIMTGTPGGVALAMRDENGRRPWLQPGDVVETRIEGLGAQRNVIN